MDYQQTRSEQEQGLESPRHRLQRFNIVDQEEIKTVVQAFFDKAGYKEVTRYPMEFADGLLFQQLYNLMYNDDIDCQLVQSYDQDLRVLNWKNINQIICIYKLNQRLIIHPNQQQILARGRSSETIFNLLNNLLQLHQNDSRYGTPTRQNIIGNRSAKTRKSPKSSFLIYGENEIKDSFISNTNRPNFTRNVFGHFPEDIQNNKSRQYSYFSLKSEQQPKDLRFNNQDETEQSRTLNEAPFINKRSEKLKGIYENLKSSSYQQSPQIQVELANYALQIQDPTHSQERLSDSIQEFELIPQQIDTQPLNQEIDLAQEQNQETDSQHSHQNEDDNFERQEEEHCGHQHNTEVNLQSEAKDTWKHLVDHLLQNPNQEHDKSHEDCHTCKEDPKLPAWKMMLKKKIEQEVEQRTQQIENQYHEESERQAEKIKSMESKISSMVRTELQSSMKIKNLSNDYNQLLEQHKKLNEKQQKLLQELKAPLTQIQIEKAQERIAFMHPTADYGIEELFPILKNLPCFKHRTHDHNTCNQLHKSLLNCHDQNNPFDKAEHMCDDLLNEELRSVQQIIDRYDKKPITWQKLGNINSFFNAPAAHKDASKDKHSHNPLQKQCSLHKKDKKEVKFAKSAKLDSYVSEDDHHHGDHNDKVEEDIFSIFGFGVNSFMDWLLNLLRLFVVISLIAVIMIYTNYASDTSNANIQNLFDKGFIQSLTLGNFPYSSNQCNRNFVFMNATGLSVRCPHGRITKLNQFGLVSFEEGLHSHLFGSDYCGNPYSKYLPRNCTKYLDSQGFEKQFNQFCIGKVDCHVKFIKTNLDGSANQEICFNDNSVLYVQAKCELSQELLTNNNSNGLIISFMGTIIIGLYICQFFIYENEVDISYKQWDLSQCCITDFTVQMPINQKLIDDFEKIVNCKQEKTLFTDFLQDSIEKTLKKKFKPVLPGSIYKDHGHKIAFITLIYDNRELILGLKKRGEFISVGDFKGLRNYEEEFNQLIHDEQNLKRFRKPVEAFITFQYQDGYERCVKHFFNMCSSILNDPTIDNGMQILGQSVHMKPAEMPSDYVWEDFEVDQSIKKKRQYWTFFLIVLCIFIASVIQFVLQYRMNSFDKYLNFADPIQFDRVFNKNEHNIENLNQILSSDANFTYEHKDVKTIPELKRYLAKIDKNFTKHGQGIGYYVSYCQNSTFNTLFNSSSICQQYVSDKLAHKFMSILVSIVVVTVNISMRNYIHYLIQNMYLQTRSEVKATTMIAVFFSQLSNILISVLLITANFQDTQVPLISWLRGPFTDFTTDWYSIQGAQIVQNQMIYSFYPWIDLLIKFLYKKIFQVYDSGCLACKRTKNGPEKTNCITTQQYVDLYGGPEYLLHFKFSQILVQVYVAMIFGFMIPLCFITTTMGIINLYLHEKITLIYYNRKPPNYGPQLTKLAMKMLVPAPIFMFAFGYWAMTNNLFFGKQMKENFELTNHEPVRTNHWHVIGKIDSPGIVLILSAIIMIVFKCSLSYCVKAITFQEFQEANGYSVLKTQQSHVHHHHHHNHSHDGHHHHHDHSHEHEHAKDDYIVIDEKLGNFFQTLTENQQARWHATELYQRNKLDIKLLSDDALDKLRQRKTSSRNVTSDENYQIIQNIIYQEAFQFMPVGQRDNINTQNQSDTITKLLNMYSQRVEHQIKFETSEAQMLKMIKKTEEPSAVVGKVQETIRNIFLSHLHKKDLSKQ